MFLLIHFFLIVIVWRLTLIQVDIKQRGSLGARDGDVITDINLIFFVSSKTLLFHGLFGAVAVHTLILMLYFPQYLYIIHLRPNYLFLLWFLAYLFWPSLNLFRLNTRDTGLRISNNSRVVVILILLIKYAWPDESCVEFDLGYPSIAQTTRYRSFFYRSFLRLLILTRLVIKI
jgi:hypothetical protein